MTLKEFSVLFIYVEITFLPRYSQFLGSSPVHMQQFIPNFPGTTLFVSARIKEAEGMQMLKKILKNLSLEPSTKLLFLMIVRYCNLYLANFQFGFEFWITNLNFALILTLSIMLTQKEKNRQLGTKLTRSFIHQQSTSGNGPAYRLVAKSG